MSIPRRRDTGFLIVLFTTSVLVAGAGTALPGQAPSRQTGESPRTSRSEASGAVRGTVIDGSGGVLPGVTVVARRPDGSELASIVTDATGSYALKDLPPGTLQLAFALDGFAQSKVPVAIVAGVESLVVGRLELAAMAETVVVRGSPPYTPPPPPVLIPVPAHDETSVCGPAKAPLLSESFGTVRGRRQDAIQGMYAKGDELVIDGGLRNGIEVGRNLVVRRRYRVSLNRGSAFITGEHTSGVVQIVTADQETSTAIVLYACDEMMKGDFLAAFNPEPKRTPDPRGTPAWDDAARILFGDPGKMSGVTRELMVIDRGSAQGIRAGQRMTIFRRGRNRDNHPAEIGDAVVVAVRADSATIRIERANDAIAIGDWAAPQSPIVAER